MYLRLILTFLLVLAPFRAAISQEKPLDEITLEVNVVQVILNDEHRFGIDWGAIVSDFHTISLKKEDDSAANDKKNRLSLGTLSNEDYTVLLDALDMAGKVSQFPQEPVKVTAGTPANVNLAQQDIQLECLLSRLKSGELSLLLKPSVLAEAAGVLKADTRLSITNNMTVVVGGFMQEEEITKTHKFPVLGSIPIVGLVFRSRGHLMQRTETVVFLTARTNAIETQEDNKESDGF